MQEGLQKVQRIISVHAELPRGLTAKLMEFMEPFAGIATLRRRLGQDRDELPATGAPAPPSAVAVALQQQTQPSGAAAGPKVRLCCATLAARVVPVCGAQHA
jgi:hypothetical protein